VAPDAERSREKGLGLLIIGGMILFFDVLILFFLPAGLKLGHKTAFIALMGPLAVLGLVLIVAGYIIRAKPE
jgi:hypothetical protein